MLQGVLQRDAAERVADEREPLQPERLDELVEIVGELGQR
jgi:hypothetical protein